MSANLYTASWIAQMICPARVPVSEGGQGPRACAEGSRSPEKRPRGPAAPEVDDYCALIRACRRNKVPLLSLDRSLALMIPFYASEPFQRAYAEDEAHWRDLRGEYMPVRGAFMAAGIRDVLLKAVGIAPALPYSSDNLDLLVSAADGPRAGEVLSSLGYVELKNVQEPHKFLYRKLHDGLTAAIVHLHEFVGWGTGFMDDAHVLDDARPAPDAPLVEIPSAEDALLITLAHAFYEDKEVKLGDLWKVMHILSGGPLDWEAVYRQASRRGWREGLDTCVWLWSTLEQRLYGQHSFPEEIARQAQTRAPRASQRYLPARLGEEALAFPLEISFRFSVRHYYRKVSRDRAIPAGQRRLDALRHALAAVHRRLPFSSQRPMLIALSGIDGSGKTTYAEALHRSFAQCGIRARIAWSRGASSALTDRVIALVKPLLARRGGVADPTGDTREAKVARKRTWLRRPLLRWGWTWLTVLDLLLRYWRTVWWPLLRGWVVIGDRYLYDALVELAVLTGDLDLTRSWAANVLLHLSPRPKLAYLLRLSPELALARKPEETLAYLIQQDEVFRQMAPAWGMQVMSADGDLAGTTDALVHRVLAEYYRDWHTLINGLFLANPVARQ